MKTCTTCGKEFSDDTKFCPEDGSTLRSAAGTADMIGSIIADRYHVTKKLGEGGMGAVYLGEHVKMGRMSAIKVMVSSMANDPDAVARFNREAANAARINHHNVCGIYDFGETEDGVIYLAMEFIEGEALTDTLEREGALGASRATDLLVQSTDALQAAHDLGIVHRDIKPDNIMVAKARGEKDLIKVVDFGIAKAVGGEEGQNVTKTGLVVGTPEYMSPEQLSGDVLDGRSDVYSIALVYYKMLTGDLPFKADTAQETMIKRLTDDPLPLAAAFPSGNFTPEMQAVMDKALQRIPSDRYSTAAEFGDAATAAASGMSASSPAAFDDADGATQLIDSVEIADVTAQTPAVGTPDDEALMATRVGGAETPTPVTPQPVAVPAEGKKKSPVIAVAATVAFLVVGGTAGVMIINRGDETDPSTSVAAATPGENSPDDTANGGQATDNSGQNPATDPPVTGNTDNDHQNPGTNPTTNDDPPDDPVTPPAQTFDIAGIFSEIDGYDQEIFNMFDPDVTRLGEIRTVLRGYHDNNALPDSIRWKAADVTVAAWTTEGSNDNALCRWIDNALAIDPDTQSRYNGTQQRLGC